eukprot:scaffold248_cov111-Cylindrotheca_fusiformis.AAC.2
MHPTRIPINRWWPSHLSRRARNGNDKRLSPLTVAFVVLDLNPFFIRTPNSMDRQAYPSRRDHLFAKITIQRTLGSNHRASPVPIRNLIFQGISTSPTDGNENAKTCMSLFSTSAREQGTASIWHPFGRAQK